MIQILKYSILVISLALLSRESIAQKVTLSGSIIDGTSLEDLSGVHVYLQAHFGTVTDIDGNFHFNASYLDTLHFSRIGYDSLSVIIKDKEAYQNVFISMKRSITILDNVDVTAVFQANTILKRPEKQIYLVPGVKYSNRVYKKNYHLGLGVIASPATALYRVFSKQYKEEKKHFEVVKAQKIEDVLFVKASENLTAVLELSDAYLDEYYYRDFIRFSGLTTRYVAESSQYELLLILPQTIKQYTIHLERKKE